MTTLAIQSKPVYRFTRTRSIKYDPRQVSLFCTYTHALMHIKRLLTYAADPRQPREKNPGNILGRTVRFHHITFLMYAPYLSHCLILLTSPLYLNYIYLRLVTSLSASKLFDSLIEKNVKPTKVWRNN